jgi:membrane associated rhomboid family serine protease
MKNWVDRLFNEHQLVRRLLVVWAIFLITWVVVQVFSDLGAINAAVASALATVSGILSMVIVHYQWSRGRDK